MKTGIQEGNQGMETQTPGARISAPSRPHPRGLKIIRYFTKAGVHPYNEITWEKRTAQIVNDNGEVIFEQKDVEVPASWTQLAVNVVVSKYFKGAVDRPGRETSVKQLINRVALTIAKWGRRQGYFVSEDDAKAFEEELIYLLVHQMLAFNSPVWFNVGIEERPQCSACFINSVEDTMESIYALARTEGMLFKWGSGTGTNLSTIRSSRERLSSGGWASGPVSFMKGYDAFAGVIKSGGKTRRAAKMVILNADHPDIVEFIECKSSEEKKAWHLIEAGYDGSINGEAYSSIFFQNSNNSVRVTDAFMNAVVEDGEWHTRAVRDGSVVETYRARDIMRKIVASAWSCGDPGLQFDTTINDWHTSANTGRINASNPCSEYMFLDNTACNLSSLNLMKFRRPDGSFDVRTFRHAVRIAIIAQDMIVDNASYPTPAIEVNSYNFRPLGLGYANLGAYLMSRGVAYDNPEGFAICGAITALMTGEAYNTSAEIARELGPFAGFLENREPMLRVIHKHRSAVDDIDAALVDGELLRAAHESWDEALENGERHGYKNSQVTVIAPTGTIGFMMDCDTTGIEPDIALIKYKKLVGGGLLKIVNRTVPEALRVLGYSDGQVQAIVDYIDREETIEGAPHLKAEHLGVFDCAFKPHKGVRTIHHMGHVRMMAAAQPFVSGAISKTVNMPTATSPDDVMQTYIDAWRMGLKAIAIYRDGCKRSQPLNTSMESGESKEETKTEAPSPAAGSVEAPPAAPVQSLAAAPETAAPVPAALPQPFRRRLLDERRSITHKFSVAGHEGYITVGMYEDGRPGEIFITMAKEGSTVSGLMDSVATLTSIALQYGVPLEVLVNKFSYTRFEPAGFTNNPALPAAKSVIDYIFRWLSLKFMPADEQPMEAADIPAPTRVAAPLPSQAAVAPAQTASERVEKRIFESQSDSPVCHECGSVMVRSGSCHRCPNCGATSGCS